LVRLNLEVASNEHLKTEFLCHLRPCIAWCGRARDGAEARKGITKACSRSGEIGVEREDKVQAAPQEGVSRRGSQAGCWDCEDDESFACESLVCGTCNLPCPCKECKKYKSRTQGLMITRQFPKEVRRRHFLQTTPIIWLSQVVGNETMDPSKLNLLTEYLVNFMEKSQNGVILVDGIEYLVTSSDFNRVLKAIDRWTETAMATANKLILSINPKAFDRRDLALLERNREVVRPEAPEPWQVFPERI
jgi:hypothetical protein